MLPTEALLLVTETLDALGVTYCIGGSFASSAYGEPRATRDADLLVDLPASCVPAVVTRLDPDFFVQRDAIHEAIALAPSLHDDLLRRASFNLVHRSSFFRIDVFVASMRPFEVSQFARRIPQTVAVQPERTAFFVSPEDIVLIKLDWYRIAQGVLDRQWADVLAVLATQGTSLDLAYLRQWAAHLGITALLDAALQGSPPPKLTPPDDPGDQLRLDL